MSRLILVTGGARSGKSDFAQDLAGRLAGTDVLFVATAEAGDDDMAARIAAHRRSRPAAWCTVEAPQRVGEALRDALPTRVVLVDCLTLLVSNVLLSLVDDLTPDAVDRAVAEEVCELVEAARAVDTVIVVTNEVGLGIVPDNRLARLYRDLLGRANATLAREATEVYLLVSGVALEIKSLAHSKGTS